MVELGSKCAHSKNLGVIGSLSEILWGPEIALKSRKCSKKSCFGTPLKSHPMTQQPPYFSRGHILTTIQPYFMLKRFQHHISPKNNNFQLFLNLLSGIRAKSLNKTVGIGGIWVLPLY